MCLIWTCESDNTQDGAASVSSSEDILSVDDIKTPEDLNTPDPLNDSVFEGELDWESECTCLKVLLCGFIMAKITAPRMVEKLTFSMLEGIIISKTHKTTIIMYNVALS